MSSILLILVGGFSSKLATFSNFDCVLIVGKYKIYDYFSTLLE